MARRGTLGLLLAATLAGTGFGWATAGHGHNVHTDRRLTTVGSPHVSPATPTPNCRNSDKMPYDPDIIGGTDHVGDGGLAVNLGGFDPSGS